MPRNQGKSVVLTRLGATIVAMTDDPMYLTKNSHGVYYYRRPIVADDQQFWMGAKGTPKKEWSRSLNTKDRRVAVAALQDAADAYEEERAAQYARYLSQPAAPQELSQREREEQAARQQAEADRQARFDARAAERIKVRRRWLLSTPELLPEDAAARDIVREAQADAQARITLLEGKLAELGAFDFGMEQPKQPLTAPPVRAAAATGAKTVSDLCDAYKAAKWDEWGESSRKAIGPVLRVLRETIGSQEVPSIDREAARSVFEAVKLLPVNLGKRKEFTGLAVPQAIEKAQRLGAPTINPNTINRGYMVQIAAVFNWAVDEDWAVKNPFVGLSVADPVHDKDRRDAFTTEQVKTLFSAAPWDARLPDAAEKPGRYWVPLIALYSGMRLGEIAGLRIMDVEELEGIPAFRVRPHEGRGLKNQESRRNVPIHSALIAMGLLSFVKHRQENGKPDDLLFPDGKANSRGQGGAKLGEWFSALLKSREIVGTKLGMHSFRHNFEDRLRAVGLHGRPEGQALGGRKIAGSEANYGSDFPIDSLRDALEKVSYPGLDLSHLHCEGRNEGAA